jgi:hypothetical protein
VSVEHVDELLVTARGYEDLRAELEALQGDRRREMTERLHEARAGGDLADNAALYDLLEEQAQLERRIAVLNAQLAAVRGGRTARRWHGRGRKLRARPRRRHRRDRGV